jgi:hypothetical protein
MSSFTFTVTQVTQNFTATIRYPINLTLSETPDTVNVANFVSTLTVINTIQPVTISGVGGGSLNPFNQSLNTGDNVSFASVTTPAIYGVAQQPVQFPTGISVNNMGTAFNGSVDLSKINTTITNQLALIFAVLPINLGSVLNPATFTIEFN